MRGARYAIAVVGMAGITAAVWAAQAVRQQPERFDFGRAATPAEIAAWDMDVRPDGTGLPAGSGGGTVDLGIRVYAAKCAECHGGSGTEGPLDLLVGPEPRDSFPFGRDPALVPTIGNYWPYATTLYDYVNRAMPFTQPGSLTADEVYGVVAYLLWRNRIVERDAVMNRETLPAVVMPARDRFVRDNRRGGAEIR